MEIIDTHCHLYFEQLKPRLDAVLKNARRAGVTKMICVGTSLQESKEATGIASLYERVWASIGVHPHEAEEFLQDASHTKTMIGLLNKPKVAAIGEIGLDYYKSRTPREVQMKALREQIEIGRPYSLPFIFHVRDAWSDFWRIFDEYDNLTGVIHSFSSGTKQLNSALERGLYIGLNGIMTFTKDQAQLEAAKQVPLDKMLLETDAPFLTPEPLRGQICEPKHTVATAEFLAKLRGESLEDLATATSANATRLFNLD